MTFSFAWKITVTAALLASGVSATSITSCPNQETSYVSGGKQYRICPGSDYAGTTLWDYHDTPTIQDCVQRCQQYSGCTQVVWDNIGHTCHIKGSGLTWVSNSQSTTARLISNAPAPGTPLQTCPYPVSTYTTQGRQYTVCPGTDYQGNTVTDIHNLKSDQACADACASYPGCYNAVYDPTGLTCHIKSPQLQLVANPDSDTIKFLDGPKSSTTTTTTTKPTTSITTTTTLRTSTTTTTSTTTSTTTTAAPTTTSAASGQCPNGAAPDSTYTASNGDIYGICKNTDFPGGDIQLPVYNVATIQACSDICSTTIGCVASNLHREPQICYLKGTKTQAAANNNVDGSYLIKAVGTNSRTGTTTAAPTTTDCSPNTVTVTVTATK